MKKALEKYKDYAIIVIDINSFVVYANEGTYSVLGWKPKEFVGRRITEIMPQQYRKMHILGMDRYIVSGQKRIDWVSSELVALKKDGTVIPIEISFGEFEREGRRFFVSLTCDTSNGERLRDHIDEGLIKTIVSEIYDE